MHDLIQAKSVFQNYRNSGFRPFQSEAISYALESEKKIVVLEASTGSGKSLIGLTIGSAFGNLSYLVHSKMLQNQITSDFPEAVSLFGRSNYSCLSNTSVSCDECFHTPLTPCRHKKSGCLYEIKKQEVLRANYRILNYDYYLSECNYVGKFSGAPLVVIDEADSLENTLINFTSLTFTPYALRRMNLLDYADKLKMTSKDKSGLLESWKDFGFAASTQVGKILSKLSHEIEKAEKRPDLQTDLIKERVRVNRLKARIEHSYQMYHPIGY
jgi:Rad3-related DNA helicase